MYHVGEACLLRIHCIIAISMHPYGRLLADANYVREVLTMEFLKHRHMLLSAL